MEPGRDNLIINGSLPAFIASLDDGPTISDGVYYDYPEDESSGIGLAIDNGYNIGGSAEGAASLFSDDPIELASMMMDLDMPEASVGTNWSDTASISESGSAVPNTSFDNSPGSAYWLSVFGDADSVPGDISAQVASGNWSSLEAGMPIDSGIGTDSLGMDSSSLPGLGNLSNSAPIPGSLSSTSTLGELWDSVFDPYAYEASTASQVSQPNWINTTTTISRNVGIAALTLATGGLAGGAVDALGIGGSLGSILSGAAAGAASSFTLSTLTQATQDGGLDLSLIDPGQTAYDTGFGTVTGGVLGTGFYGASVLGGDIADGLSSFSNNYGGLALAGNTGSFAAMTGGIEGSFDSLGTISSESLLGPSAIEAEPAIGSMLEGGPANVQIGAPDEFLNFGVDNSLQFDVPAAETPMARGLVSQTRVLNDLGLEENTSIVSTAEGNSIPDALTDDASYEIKDTQSVSLTRQLRIQTDAAAASGRQSMLITGTNTDISGPAEDAFDQIIRRDDLGPQK